MGEGADRWIFSSCWETLEKQRSVCSGSTSSDCCGLAAHGLKIRFIMDKIKVVNPFTGSMYKKIVTARFSGALSLTLKSGMTITEGFGLVSGVLDNDYVIRKIREAVNEVSSSKPFWEAIRDTGLFPVLFVRLVKTGEKTGNLDAMMEKVSHTWQEEVDASLGRVVGFIEPVCVTVLSLILAGVLLSVILP